MQVKKAVHGDNSTCFIHSILIMAISVANLSRRLRFENFPSFFQSRRTNLCQSVLIQTFLYAVNKNVLIETIRQCKLELTATRLILLIING